MLALSDAHPAVAVQEPEYRRLLGYPPGHEVGGRALELAAWARDWYNEHGRPWWSARQAGPLALLDGRVRIDGTTFTSGRLVDMLREGRAESAVVVAVSAGAECEAMARRLWEDGKPDEYFFLEVYGSAVVEALVALAAYQLCEWADGHGMAVLPHYSPGYPGWDISDQQPLLSLTASNGGNGVPGAIRVLESGMLQPKKSLLAVFGLTSHVAGVLPLMSLVPCANCSLPACQYRRAAYRHPMPQLEGVRAVPPAPGGASPPAAARATPLTIGARYRFSPKVLGKWAHERLRITPQGDGAIEATFRYEGTTCSNMGYPLEFEYHVRLAAPEQNLVITDLRCAPATGDVGHTRMCEYLTDPDALMHQIGDAPPLLGRPLDDVIGWQRPHSPSGCYCSAEGRTHKWGLALEVLHFALARNQAEAG